MTNTYDEDVLEIFLKNQRQLFPEDVASNYEEAEFFLEDVMAVVCDNKDELFDVMEDSMDMSGMSEDEILGQSEVFAIGDGRFLYVEG